MPLPGGGSISMSQINTELGRSSTAQISLDTAENGGYGAINTCSQFYPSSGNPASMSEWYSYNHSAACCPPFGTFLSSYCSGCDKIEVYANGKCGSYTQTISNHPSCGCGCPPYGTFLGTFCFNCDVYYQYANGACGSYWEYGFTDCPTCGI